MINKLKSFFACCILSATINATGPSFFYEYNSNYGEYVETVKSPNIQHLCPSQVSVTALSVCIANRSQNNSLRTTATKNIPTQKQ